MTFFMAGQTTFLNEPSTATWKFTFIWAFACMRIGVSLHVGMMRKGLRTEFAPGKI